jgi:hypothetical protein
MSRLRLLLIACAVLFLLFAGVVAGAWWYFFGPNEIASAELVPANTIAFVEIPNGALLVDAFQSSAAKKLLDSPNIKPAQDAIVATLGQKNIDLLQVFLPNLSGQSFIALTRYDYDHPESIGLVAAMKPKAGMGDFGAFLDKLKATYPDFIKQGQIGKGSVLGYDYDWIQGPGAPDKICVAYIRGWIVTTWGEASLQDWIERFKKKSTTSSLADDVNYRKSISRVGDDPMTLAYVNYRAMMEIAQKQVAKTDPAAGKFIASKLDNFSGAAVATRFENDEIVDRYTFLMPRPAQIEAGMGEDPCPFDTLKFTGHDTHFYWAASVNWKQYYLNMKAQEREGASASATDRTTAFLQDWVHSAGLDVQHNIVDALGPEISVQSEWGDDTTFPEVGLFVKLDKPDDFKPVINAFIDSVRKAYANTGVVKQITLNNQNFATLNFVPSGVLSPTITEDGPYLGVFLTANQAVRSFQRDASLGLTHNDNFNRQIGDKRNGAQQIVFLDTPYLLDRAYKTAMPYLSMAEMFSPPVASAMKGRQLPDDLTWLAPMGTWSCVVTTDESGVQAYSVSGVGNQGLLLSGSLGATMEGVQALGILPKTGGPLSFPGFPTLGSGPGDRTTPPAPAPPVVTPVITPVPTPSVPAPPVPIPSAPGTVPPATNASPNATPPPTAPTNP